MKPGFYILEKTESLPLTSGAKACRMAQIFGQLNIEGIDKLISQYIRKPKSVIFEFRLGDIPLIHTSFTPDVNLTIELPNSNFEDPVLEFKMIVPKFIKMQQFHRVFASDKTLKAGDILAIHKVIQSPYFESTYGVESMTNLSKNEKIQKPFSAWCCFNLDQNKGIYRDYGPEENIPWLNLPITTSLLENLANQECKGFNFICQAVGKSELIKLKSEKEVLDFLKSNENCYVYNDEMEFLFSTGK